MSSILLNETLEMVRSINESIDLYGQTIVRSRNYNESEEKEINATFSERIKKIIDKIKKFFISVFEKITEKLNKVKANILSLLSKAILKIKKEKINKTVTISLPKSYKFVSSFKPTYEKIIALTKKVANTSSTINTVSAQFKLFVEKGKEVTQKDQKITVELLNTLTNVINKEIPEQFKILNEMKGKYLSELEKIKNETTKDLNDDTKKNKILSNNKSAITNLTPLFETCINATNSALNEYIKSITVVFKAIFSRNKKTK